MCEKKYRPEVKCKECQWRPTRTADGLCGLCAERKEVVRPIGQPTEDEMARFYDWVQRKAAELGIDEEGLEEQGFPVTKAEYPVWRSLYGRESDGGQRGGQCAVEGGGQAAAAERRADVGGGDDDRPVHVRAGVRSPDRPGRGDDVRVLSVQVDRPAGSGDPAVGGGRAGADAGDGDGQRAEPRAGVGRVGDGAGPVRQVSARPVRQSGATLFDYLREGVEGLWPRGAECRFQPLDRVVLVRRVGGYEPGRSGDVLRCESGPDGVTYTVAMGGRLELEVDECDLRPWMAGFN